ncbi:telomeric repeat-binding factor 1 isoform X1 [Clupea harengus]|uniref:Telomeric repeat-binding factor n=1 Tax=Clupea harengus TaxID=7950 RepID=A0A6P3VHG6_CLUHA|nr:telomeric repeat-binding factor 1 isoform X1 [Clupea harengus]
MNGNIASQSIVTITSTTDENYSSSDVDCLVKSWMIDYLFLSITRHFKEKNSEEFVREVRSFEAMIDGLELEDHQMKKKLVCGFLARVMDAKNLDVRYTHDEVVTPLMSAVTVWNAMDEVVADANLHQTVKRLLFVQSVGVCLEKGMPSIAKNALQWLERECGLPEKLQMKLASIVSAKNTDDPYLTSFSFARLLDKIQSFLDAILEENPSNFLLQAGSKVVHARQDKDKSQVQTQELEESACTEQSTDQPTQNGDLSLHSKLSMRPKKRLLAKRTPQPWIPDSAKKPSVVNYKESKIKVSRLSGRYTQTADMDTSVLRTKRMWMSDEDRCLKAGVRQYGEGKWTKILQEYDFGKRTAIMLKDRWRTLKRLHLV